MTSNLVKTQYIANKIIELRDSVNWSQSELARKSGVTGAAISQIEKGDRMPSLIVLRKLAEAFNVSVSELTGDSTSSSNDEAQIFFRKFGDLKNLSEADQKMIQSIISRLQDEKNDKC